jgi:hypothetical protein
MSDPAFLKKLKLAFMSFKKNYKIFGCSQLFILETCNKSCLDTFEFELHKKDKHIDPSMYFSNLQIYQILHLSVAHHTNNFVLKFYMLVYYTIDYILDLFS